MKADYNYRDAAIACANRAYLDLCRRISFKYSSSQIEKMSINRRKEYISKKARFRSDSVSFIVDSIAEQVVNCSVFMFRFSPMRCGIFILPNNKEVHTMNAFDKIIGYKSIVDELLRIADILKNTEEYRRKGVNIPHGLLLHGEPGLGKTLMTKCLIEESNRHAFFCRKDKHNGDFVDTIRGAFETATKNEPSIIVLDDMDKFANDDEHHRNSEEYVTVQSCIDSVKEHDVYSSKANRIGSYVLENIRVISIMRECGFSR